MLTAEIRASPDDDGPVNADDDTVGVDEDVPTMVESGTVWVDKGKITEVATAGAEVIVVACMPDILEDGKIGVNDEDASTIFGETSNAAL